MSLAEDFVPREWQAQIIGDPKKGIPMDDTKYKVIVAHRKSGKTVMALMYLFMKAWTCTEGIPKGIHSGMRVPRFTYIGPTYKQAKDIAWDLLKDIVPKWALLKKPNESNLEIRLTNRVIINIKGADKEDSLRGPGLSFALLDEYAFMKPNVWSAVIEPELAQTGGGAMFIGTPDGRNHFHDVYKLGRDNVKNWKSWLVPVTQPTIGFDIDPIRGQALLADGFLEEQRAQVTEKFFNQEYECEFNDDAGMVFNRVEENVIDEFLEYPENGHRYRLGVDPALREDWTAISVLDLTDWKVKYVYRTNKIDAELLYSNIENMANRWTSNMGAPEVMFDSTGMGDPMYDSLVKRGLNITPIKFTNARKMEMVETLNKMLSHDEIKIPRYEWLIDEIKDYRYERLPSGRYRYGAPTGRHDDGVTSLMLVVYHLPPKQVVQINNRDLTTGGYKPNKFTGY